MEEKEQENEKFSIDTENLKNETVETAKKVKESVKSANIKEETKATKGVIVDLFKNPLEKIKEIANDNSGKYFKTAIFIIIVWAVALLISSIYSTTHYWNYYRAFGNVLAVIKKIIAPVCGIIIYSLIILVLNKNNKKPLTALISAITITQVPLVLAAIVSLLKIISLNINTVTIPFTNLCQVISIVLGFFGFKYLFGIKESKEFIKKYVLIQTIYYVAYIIIGLLGIYI